MIIKKDSFRKIISLLLAITLLAVLLPSTALAQKVTEPRRVIPTLEADKQYIYSAWLQEGRLWIYLKDFQANHVLLLKARDGYRGVGPWYQLEKLRISKQTTFLKGYILDPSLAKKLFITVCIKDRDTAELDCRTLFNLKW